MITFLFWAASTKLKTKLMNPLASNEPKITWNKNPENLSEFEVTKVALINCSLNNNSYQLSVDKIYLVLH